MLEVCVCCCVQCGKNMMAAGCICVCEYYKLTVVTYNTVTHFDASYLLGQIAADVALFPTTVMLVTLNIHLTQCL
jgi:hypothetical protein